MLQLLIEFLRRLFGRREDPFSPWRGYSDTGDSLATVANGLTVIAEIGLFIYVTVFNIRYKFAGWWFYIAFTLLYPLILVFVNNLLAWFNDFFLVVIYGTADEKVASKMLRERKHNRYEKMELWREYYNFYRNYADKQVQVGKKPGYPPSDSVPDRLKRTYRWHKRDVRRSYFKDGSYESDVKWYNMTPEERRRREEASAARWKKYHEMDDREGPGIPFPGTDFGSRNSSSGSSSSGAHQQQGGYTGSTYQSRPSGTQAQKPSYDAELDNAYKTLELPYDAPETDVRVAYRRIAMSVHPDKLQSLDEQLRKAGEERFRRVKDAYELICRKKGYK